MNKYVMKVGVLCALMFLVVLGFNPKKSDAENKKVNEYVTFYQCWTNHSQDEETIFNKATSKCRFYENENNSSSCLANELMSINPNVTIKCMDKVGW